MEQLGRYQLGARIATGGMAEVFLARSEGVQGFAKTVVIKRLLPHLAREPQVVEMFLNEARLTGRLDHPNVVQVLDLGEDHNAYYIAMEFLDGRALSEVRDAARAKGGMLPIPFVLRVVSDALAGLHNAHDARGDDGRALEIIHRDFNPDNIVVTYDGRVKVVDFGIAKAQANPSSTEPGTLKGKYFYMAPEMVLGAPMDRRIDLFAAGVILYELLCDKRPFEGDTPNAILSGIAYGKPPMPRTINPAIPEELEAIIMRTLAKGPADRPATAMELKQHLDGLLARETSFATGEVSAMMNLLFPPGQDAERTRIGELRKLDPSLPPTGTPLSAPLGPVPTTYPSASGKPMPELLAGQKPKPSNLVPLLVGAALLLGLTAVVARRFLPALPTSATKEDPQKDRMSLLQKRAEEHPEQPEASDDYAKALLDEGNLDQADKVISAELNRHADDGRGHSLKGDILQRRRLGQRALDEYQRALQLRPDDVTTWQHLANLQKDRGDFPAAREAMSKALGFKPNDLDLVKGLADLEGRTGDWEKVVALLNPFTARFPQDADLRSKLGFALLQTGDDRRALIELQAAERIHPKDPGVQTNLAAIYYHQQRTQKAVEACKAAIATRARPGGFGDRALHPGSDRVGQGGPRRGPARVPGSRHRRPDPHRRQGEAQAAPMSSRIPGHAAGPIDGRRPST